MAAIVAFGNPVYDMITTPLVTTGGRVLSGCSTNACLVLSRLGHTTTLVGRIGPDYYERIHSDAERYKLDLNIEQSDQTGGFQLVYDARGDRTLDVLGVAGPISSLPETALASADAVIIGPIMQETSSDLIHQIAAHTKAPLFLDPQGLLRRIESDGHVEHYRDAQIDLIAPLCTVIKANELETRIITGLDPREHGPEAAQRLHALGCKIAIVTLAEAGSIIYDGQKVYRIPAYSTVASDPTGAGDTYLAGFIDSYLHNPHDLFTAGCAGSATSSIWIEHTGPDALVSRNEVDHRRSTVINNAERG
jgi:sugar/nucleoside kinase (ribokinase family)